MGTFSLFGTVWAESNIDSADLRHEYGHSVQEHLLGPIVIPFYLIWGF